MARDPESTSRLSRSTASNSRLLAWSSVTFASRVLARVSQLLFLVAAARLLTIDEFATYSYLVVLAVTFGMLADTGIALGASREVSAGRIEPAQAFWSALPVIAVGAAVGGVAMFAFGMLDSGPGTSLGVLLAAAAYVAVNMAYSFAMTILRSLGRFGVEAALQFGTGIGFLAAGVAAAAAGLGLGGVLGALLATQTITAVLALVILWPEVRVAHGARWSHWRPLLRIGIKLAVASTALAVATRSGVIVLANTGSERELAWFSAPLRLADAVMVFALTAGYSLLPGVSHVMAKDPARARRLVRRIIGGAVALTTVGAVVSVSGAEFIVTTLFGSDFKPAAEPARVLLAALPAYAVLGICWYSLLTVDAERPLMWVGVAGALGALVASLLFVPTGADVGAAWVYVGTLTAMAAACLVVLTRRMSGGAVAEPQAETGVVVA